MPENLKKYLIDPEFIIDTISDEEWGTIEIEEPDVTHKGLRHHLTCKVWVGPGVKANMSSTYANCKFPWTNTNFSAPNARKKDTSPGSGKTEARARIFKPYSALEEPGT